jgi:integrase
MMYVIAAWTGYRKGEIGILTASSFQLDDDPPSVTVEALYSKRRRRDSQVLHPELAAHIRAWLAEKQPSPRHLLFPVSGRVGGVERKTSKMMRVDLAAARAKWLDEEPELREQREKSDYLEYRDQQGRYADFHANRHTFITNLSRAGVSPKTAQTLARHSDVRLTLNVYSQTELAEKQQAIQRLSDLWECARVPSWHRGARRGSWSHPSGRSDRTSELAGRC